MQTPTALDILTAVRTFGPRGYKRFTEAHARRIEFVICRKASAVGAAEPANVDFDALTAEVLEQPSGSVLGIVFAFGFSSIGQWLIQSCVKWAVQWAWKRYLDSRKA